MQVRIWIMSNMTRQVRHISNQRITGRKLSNQAKSSQTLPGIDFGKRSLNKCGL